MKTKRSIYEYDGYLFDEHDELEEYVANKTGEQYNNADPFDTPAFYDEMSNVKEIEVEWEIGGHNGDFVDAIKPILSTINVLAHTTLDKQHLNNLIKELQIKVNWIEK